MSGERQAVAIFCDDVRQEVNGKLSFMGCYAGVMEVASFPLIAPKLVVFVRASTMASKPFKRLTVRVLNGDELVGEGDVPSGAIAKGAQRRKGVTAEEQLDLEVHVHLVFAPLSIMHPCTLRAYVETEDGEMSAGRLVVRARASNV
ncbi:MAG TPA: hypothetical protein VM469_06060 [Pseudoxanthomonas sp.]|nr:hypothetical protein [Pseudoxanthomonas sp.]